MSRPSLAVRAATAVLLTIGFYVLALGIAFGLLYAVYAELVYTHHVYARPTIFAVVAAGAILWSILPRFDSFKAPGPELDPNSQPELFAVIRDVAGATQQRAPASVYLVGDVNAWVAQRGGIAGFGSRRVMGIGLPLLQTLTVAQLRAVLGHEFGHYHGGDTALGPWIYRTRETMSRTIVNLMKSGSKIHAPFVWYGNLFMRVTQAISRAQELAADQLAAKIAGARHMIDALIATQRAGASFDAYWNTEVMPLLSNGFRPRIATGLQHFMKAEPVEKQLGDIVARELTEGKADPYDSHPPLRERVAALQKSGGETEQSPPAISLLRDVDRLEHDLLAPLFNDPKQAASLRLVEWEEAVSQVYEPGWRKSAAEYAQHFEGITIASIPMLVETFPEFAVRMGFKHDDALQSAANILGCTLITRLIDNGWVADSSPGAGIMLSKGGVSLEPFLLLGRLRKKEMTATQWREQFASSGADQITLK
jgi:heat shock protein HtpX